MYFFVYLLSNVLLDAVVDTTVKFLEILTPLHRLCAGLY